jgi:SPP1 gp7 family putative phage head morphogenesis protein
MLKRYWGDNATQITNIVAQGFQLGVSTRELTNQVMGQVGNRLNKSKEQAKSIARTGTNHYANQARKEYFEENDVIIGTRRVATLDSATSGICRGIDQTVVLKSESGYRSAFAPFHPNCRTANIPEINGKYTQDDDGGQRATNFRVDGDLDPKPVNSKNIYYEELRKLDAGSQDKVLGPSLGKAYRKMLKDGGTPSEFAKLTVNTNLNKSYTLAELKSQDNVLSKILNKQGSVTKKRKSIKIKPSTATKKAPANIVNIESSSKIKAPKGTVKLKGDTIKATPFEVIKRREITGDESAYLEYYKGDGFSKHNDILRNPRKYGKGEVDSAMVMRDSINSAAGKFETSTDSSVYRGVRGSSMFNSIDESSIGKTISIKTPQSTSTDARVALNYSGSVKVGDDYFTADKGSVIFKINVPKGSGVIDMEKIVGSTGEKEILIPSGGGYKVKSIESRTDADGNVTLKIINVDLI